MAEIWWDISQAKTMADAERFLACLLGSGMTQVMVMVNKSERKSGKIKWSWSSSGLEVFGRMLHARGIRLGITSWAWPEPAAVEEIYTGCQRLAQAVPLAEIELDLEGPWHRRNSTYKAFADACMDLYRKMRSICTNTGSVLGVTSYPLHGEWVQSPSVAEHADVCTPQAYSRFEPDQSGEPTGYSWSGVYGPGKMQALSGARVRQCAPREIVMGLALYGQQGDGHSPAEWMDAALAATLPITPRVRYWSAKHAWGSRKNGAVADWLAAQFGP